jgi:predicted glycosyltransferase
MAARGKRILIYSHDSFGLGHLRRCRAIAHSLVEADKDLSVLILSGSPIIGSFDFRSRVDFVRVPGVIKRRSGAYTSLNLHIAIDETLAMRASIIQHTADIFDPDLFLVDKEPLGLRGEVLETLNMLKARGTPLVLGLRDVMDEPAQLAPEWARKNVLPAIKNLYDEIWVYGLPIFCDPLAGIEVPPSVRQRMTYTGYLRREALKMPPPVTTRLPEKPYLLIMAGGGGDGEDLIDWTLRAYESASDLPYSALMVFGPFMAADRQVEFRERAARLDNVATIVFEANIEMLIEQAVGIVAMGGYNTFCEILSFDKRALIVPRTRPRMEQYIRTARAQELGLVQMLANDGVRRTRDMVTALRRLPLQKRPSDTVVAGLLDGLDSVQRLVARRFYQRRGPRVRLARSLA